MFIAMRTWLCAAAIAAALMVTASHGAFGGTFKVGSTPGMQLVGAGRPG